ncbi:MAG: hypothetical protein KF861_03440 [Planctomycetaceae bacterium]|nr:hypothetical protein [Planctomycetaceae bacterium]
MLERTTESGLHETEGESAADPTAARLAALGVALDPEIDYRLSTVFPKLEGWGVKGAIKRKAKLIKQIEPHLKEMLHPGEEVLFVSKGVQYSFAEQYFMGLWAATINQTVFVLTNLRLLMLRTRSNGRPKETFWTLYYNQIQKFKGGWTGMLELKLRDGRKLKFSGFPKLDRKTMPQVFEQTLEGYRTQGFDPQVSQSLENLCSGCFTVVPKQQFDCEDCGVSFWRPRDVALRSLFIPSWGDIVMKHYTIAVVELIGAAIAWFIAFSMIFKFVRNGDPVALIVAAVVLFFTHVVDAMVTYHVAGKGLHPRSRRASDA